MAGSDELLVVAVGLAVKFVEHAGDYTGGLIRQCSSRYCREKIIDVRSEGGWAMVYKAEAGQQQLTLRKFHV